MMGVVIAFVAGLLLGGLVGFLVTALIIASDDDREDYYDGR